MDHKRLTIIPSIKVQSPTHSEQSVFRKDDRFSSHILPLSAVRQPLKIVDTTFVIKPEEIIMDVDIHNDDDEPNGTYRAPGHENHSYLSVPQPDTLFMDTQPNFPAGLCFTPTILQDRTGSQENDIYEHASSSSSLASGCEKNKTGTNIIFPSLYQNRTSMINNIHCPFFKSLDFFLKMLYILP